jgi:hypothetical protein
VQKIGFVKLANNGNQVDDLMVSDIATGTQWGVEKEQHLLPKIHLVNIFIS